MPTLLAEQDTDIAVGPPAQLSGFKPDFISNTWAAAGRAEVNLRDDDGDGDGWGGKNNIRPTISLSDLPPGIPIHTLSCR